MSVLFVLFVLNTLAILNDVPGQWLLLTIQGLLLVSLFHLLHECVHGTVFSSRWPNHAIAHLCGFLLFLPSIWFRCFHFAHHRHTQLPGKDPELDSEKPASIASWLIHVSGVKVWLGQFRVLVSAMLFPVKDRFVPVTERAAVRNEIRIMVIGYVTMLLFSVVVSSDALWKIWILPILLGQPFLRLYLLAEHTRCAMGSNLFLNTRTVLTNPVVRWFTWNMPFHAEHHIYPAVPFHRLPDLHAMVSAQVAVKENGYVLFNAKYLTSLGE